MSKRQLRSLIAAGTLADGKPRVLKWKDEISNKHAFIVEGRGGPRPMTSAEMGTAMGRLSVTVGFERRLRFYDIRHGCAQALVNGGATLEQMKDALGHGAGSGVATRIAVLAAKDGNTLQPQTANVTQLPNPGIPRFLTSEEKENANAQSSKVGQKRKALEEAEAGQDLKDIKRAKVALSFGKESAASAALDTKQRDWLNGDKAASAEPSRGANKVTEDGAKILRRLGAILHKPSKDVSDEFVDILIDYSTIHAAARARKRSSGISSDLSPEMAADWWDDDDNDDDDDESSGDTDGDESSDEARGMRTVCERLVG